MNATDINTGQLVERPIIDSEYKYDLDIKAPNNKVWQYVGSSNFLESYSTESFKDTFKKIEEVKGFWRIIEAKTGKVIKTND